MSSPPLELHYAPSVPWRRTRQARRIFLLLAVLILALGFYVWPIIRRSAPQLYWERQARNYSLPPGTITYSDDPQDISKLAGTGGYVGGGYQGLGSGSFVVAPNLTFQKLISAHLGYQTTVTPAVFLHGRESPSGSQHLIAVQLLKLSSPDPYSRLIFFPYVHRTVFGDIPSSLVAFAQLQMCLAPGDRVRIYEGQPDPADKSHFTIDYDLNGQRGTIDGNLGNNGIVTLTPRTGKTVSSGALLWSPGGAPMPPP